MVTLEDELRRMGIPEEKVPVVTKAVFDAAVVSTCSVDGILSSLRILIDLEKPKAQALNADWLVNG